MRSRNSAAFIKYLIRTQLNMLGTGGCVQHLTRELLMKIVSNNEPHFLVVHKVNQQIDGRIRHSRL